MSICDAEENEHHACQHESGQEHEEPEGSGCYDECITKFVCQQPPMGVVPVDAALEQDIWSLIIAFLQPVQEEPAPPVGFEERLPATLARGSMALRAPPADC